jgi:hypothetical protein
MVMWLVAISVLVKLGEPELWLLHEGVDPGTPGLT